MTTTGPQSKNKRYMYNVLYTNTYTYKERQQLTARVRDGREERKRLKDKRNMEKC